MVDIIRICYRRGIIPDNLEPEKELKKYEAENFEVEVELNEGDTVEDAFDLAEKTVLEQYGRMENRRTARRDQTSLHAEILDIERKIMDADEKMYDVEKLKSRKKELEALLIG